MCAHVYELTRQEGILVHQWFLGEKSIYQCYTLEQACFLSSGCVFFLFQRFVEKLLSLLCSSQKVQLKKETAVLRGLHSLDNLNDRVKSVYLLLCFLLFSFRFFF